MSMDYELAKQLKDAGFPQKERMAYWMKHDGEDPFVIHPGLFNRTVQSYRDGYPLSEVVAAPTLEELIEACGTDFMLTNECGIWEAWSNIGAKRTYPARLGETGAEHECKGSTPTEAVANLYLALKQKHD